MAKVQIGIRVEEETRDKFERIAKDNHRSLTGQIIFVMEEHIFKKKQEADSDTQSK